jgi:hypothetical protein
MPIPRIDRLTLPASYPTLAAMKSWGHNEHFYHPDLWDLQYVPHRYLSGMTDEGLRQRYGDILRNMTSYTRPARDAIPIISYQSSWYWFRKEYHTRLEFALRGILPPSMKHLPPSEEIFHPRQRTIPNGENLIFRYGKREHLEQLLKFGRLRFSPAETYREAENNDARRDDERQKHSYKAGRYITMIHESGRQLRALGDLRRTVGGPPYHLVCFSCVWSEHLFDEFQADACIAVTNPEEFARRLEMAGRSTFSNWYFHHNPVHYFDPYEQIKNEPFDSAMSKDFRFAYQQEYRILWSQLEASPIEGFQFIDIGPADDIMAMYDRTGAEIRLG